MPPILLDNPHTPFLYFMHITEMRTKHTQKSLCTNTQTYRCRRKYITLTQSAKLFQLSRANMLGLMEKQMTKSTYRHTYLFRYLNLFPGTFNFSRNSRELEAASKGIKTCLDQRFYLLLPILPTFPEMKLRLRSYE